MVSSHIGKTPPSYRRSHLSLQEVADIVGLHLPPSAAAMMPCTDKRSRVQIPDVSSHCFPMAFGNEIQTQYYVRHGTVSLFGAPDFAADKPPRKAPHARVALVTSASVR
jgi:hypothetical protein